MNRDDVPFGLEDIETSSAPGFLEVVNDTTGSPLVKYQDLVVGDRRIWCLLKYEALTMTLANIPGLLGLFLRQKLYRLLLGEMGKGTVIGTGVSLRQPGKIATGRSCVIDDLASVSVRGSDDAGIRLADNVLVGRGSVLMARDGQIEIDENTTIGNHCRIAILSGKARIGTNVMIAGHSYIGGGSHKMERVDVPMAWQGGESRGGVTIEDDIWIGAQSVVLDGVTIGKGSIIGAGSLVNKDIPPYSIAFGRPASVYKTRE